MITRSSITYVFLILTIFWRNYINADYIEAGIINGSPVSITDVPFMALYRPKGKGVSPYHCGAVIIHEKFLISAAHCYIKLIPEYRVTVGTDHALEGGVDYDIEETIIHPKYNQNNNDCDVLVIKIKDKLTFNDRVQKIEMASHDLEIDDGVMLDTMGFGLTNSSEENSFSNELLRVSIPYVNQNDCKKIFSKLTSRMICAGGTDKDSCMGDSGGPLTYQNLVVGLVSYGRTTCGQVGIPAVYTKLSAVRDFIDKIITT
ncbi:PREDICTED: trypsin-1-like [Papilio xuthus]|uniref:Trypsin-1-like n=1 Tax=Papilio xuthus TaxID=66420 RepID=A0AAJ6ZSL1_PAPXU|nr:PREDICTED: trypsin-1-like [Papilio xuthus]